MKKFQRILGSMMIILFILSGCSQYFMKDNPNVENPLDVAKLETDVLTSWYVDTYQLAIRMNNDAILSEDSRKILINKINPTLDMFKKSLVAYISNIQMIENNPVHLDTDMANLQNLSNRLTVLKGMIVKYLISIENAQ